MAPKEIWQDFVYKGVVTKAAKTGTGKERYHQWKCPYCDELVDAIVSEKNNKRDACIGHFWNRFGACKKRPETDRRGQRPAPRPTPATTAAAPQPEVVVGQPIEAPTGSKRKAEPSITAVDTYASDAEEQTDAEQEHIVYGLFYLPRNVYVYVGSTKREADRFAEHINLTSGCRRVAIALCQPQVQPLEDFYRLERLWAGAVTAPLLRAVEQVYIDKLDTRVFPRPTNGVTRDIDLINGAEPRQLNIARACRCPDLVRWARERVAKDTQIVSIGRPTYNRDLEEVLARAFNEQLDGTSVPRIISKYVQIYGNDVSEDQLIGVEDVHAALLQVKAALRSDDGQDIQLMVDANLNVFNPATVPNRSFRVQMIHQTFVTMATAIGMRV